MELLYGIRMGSDRRVLLCVAAPAECERVLAAFKTDGGRQPGARTSLRPCLDLLATGVGPTAAGVSAAGAIAVDAPTDVISLGIGGALPGSAPGLLEVVLSMRSILAGEGRAAAGGLTSLEAMGFGPFGGRDEADTHPDLVAHLRPLAAHAGPVATVSATSGTDEIAREVAERTGALVEAMEGAAVHLACNRAEVRFAEMRVISNIAGDRERHPWKLAESLDRLGPLALEIAGALGV